MNSHIFSNGVSVTARGEVREQRKRKLRAREATKENKGENRGGRNRCKQIITRILSRCVKSVTLQRWARQGRDQWAAFC